MSAPLQITSGGFQIGSQSLKLGSSSSPLSITSSGVSNNGVKIQATATNASMKLVSSGVSLQNGVSMFPNKNLGTSSQFQLIVPAGQSIQGINPLPPTGVQASAVDATTASVSFSAPSSLHGVSISYYTVTSNPGNVTATGSSSPIHITGLDSAAGAYTFTVTATSVHGTSIASTPSDPITLVAPGPSAPTNIVATQYVGTSAKISFTSSASSFRVTSTPGNLTETGESSPIFIGGLSAGTAYTFKVVAIDVDSNESPESEPSNSVTVSNIPAAVDNDSGQYQLMIIQNENGSLRPNYFYSTNFGASVSNVSLIDVGATPPRNVFSDLGITAERIYSGELGGMNGEYISIITWTYSSGGHGSIIRTSNANDSGLIPTWTKGVDVDGNPVSVDAESIQVSGSGQYQFVVNAVSVGGDGDETIVSSDYGVTWEIKDTGYGSGVYPPAGISGDGQVMVFEKDSGVIRISTDAGSTWNDITIDLIPANTWMNSLKLNQDGSVIVLNYSQAYYISRDGGQTFRELPSSLGSFGIVTVDGRGDRLLFNADDVVQYSFDGGITWNDSTLPFTYISYGYDIAYSSSGTYATLPFERTINGSFALWRSTDQGQTFSSSSAGLGSSYFVYRLSLAPRTLAPLERL